MMRDPNEQPRPSSMMEQPLLLSSIITYAAAAFPYQEIVARRSDGTLDRTTFAAFEPRCRAVAAALQSRLKVQPGECVATLAWNSLAHLELYFAIPGIAAVCHTLNIRYSDEHLAFIINRTGNRVVFVEEDQFNRIIALTATCPTIETIVVLGTAASTGADVEVLSYHDVVSSHDAPLSSWPEFDERSASSLCFSSGSTGDPKGALYSHRSTIIYVLSGLASGQMGIDPTSTILPAVPLYHVNGWCKAHQALIAGAKLVLPGSRMAGPDLHPLIEGEGVTTAFGVPTIWAGYVEHLRKLGQKPTNLRSIGFGGGTPPAGLLKTLREDYQLEYRCGFGMTETTTGLGAGFFGPDLATADTEQWIKSSQSLHPIYGIDLRIRKEDGTLADQGEAQPGELECRGHFVIDKYFEDTTATSAAFTEDGWFKTGDVISMDSFGRFRVVDRLKDMIKSGGEWISTQALESIASTHPDVAEVAVIGLPHPRWQERPFMVVRIADGGTGEVDSIRQHIAEHAPKWWTPDAIECIAEIPQTATGKVNKRLLKERYANASYNDDGVVEFG